MRTWSPMTSVTSGFGVATLRTITPSARYSSVPLLTSGFLSRCENRYSTKGVLTGGVRASRCSRSSSPRLNAVLPVSSSALSRIVRIKRHIPEVIQVEPIVRGEPCVVRETVRETLHHVHQRGIPQPSVARQLEVEHLEMQLVAIAAAKQPESQHHGHLQRRGEQPRR